MPNFRYTAVGTGGKNKKGQLEATDKVAAITTLKESGLFPISVTEVSTMEKEITFGNPVKVRDLTIFCQQFETVLSAGVSVLECLDLLKAQTENKVLSKVIGDLYKTIETGESLAGSMKLHPKYFPSILVSMIEAGEASGSLEIALSRMAEHFEKEYKIQQAVKKAVMYPIIVSVVALSVVTMLIAFVVPTFVGMFESSGVELPGPTRLLLNMSDFIVGRWYVIVGVVIAIIIAYKLFMVSEYGKITISKLKLRMPIIGSVTTKVIASRFSRTLSTLIAAGLPLLEAIEIVSRVVDNYTVEKGLMHTKDQVSKGVPLSKPIREMNVFPPMITHMVKIGENTGQLEPILNQVADFYDGEVETAVAQLTSMLEPIIMVFLAVVVGFIVISMALPMFDMVQTVQ